VTHEHIETQRERRRRFDQYLILVGILIVIAAVALALVLVLDDDSDNKSATSTASTQTSVPTTPEEFATAAYDAWTRGDRTAAASYASPEAVEQLFSVPYAPFQTDSGPTDPLHFRGCDGAAGSVICSWTGDGDARLVMTVRDTTGGLPILVTQVQRAEGAGAI
jgi:hypothetical protein